MRDIHFRVEDDVYEAIENIKDSTGMKYTDIFLSSIIDIITDENIKRKLELRKNHLKKKKMSREFFYFKNALQRIYKEVSWQLRIYGAYNQERVNNLIDEEINGFNFLDDTAKKLLDKEKKMFLTLKDQKNMQSFIDSSPIMVNKNTRQLR